MEWHKPVAEFNASRRLSCSTAGSGKRIVAEPSLRIVSEHQYVGASECSRPKDVIPRKWYQKIPAPGDSAFYLARVD
jgi:hypothetical protein